MDLNRVYVIDIETNTLLANMLDYREYPLKLRDDAKLWCIVIRRVGDNAVFKAVKEECTEEWLKTTLADCDFLVAHNGIKFDLITLKLFGILDYSIGHLEEPDLLFGREVRFIDSLLLSRLLNPDRYPGHSLEAWGERLKEPKMDYRQALIDAGLLDHKAPKAAEFGFYNDIMLDYCIQDTAVNAKVFISLVNEMAGYPGWKQALRLETKLADYAIRRESVGFFFDKELALKLIADLTEKIDHIKSVVNPILPPRTMLTKAEQNLYKLPVRQIKADGTPTTALLNRVRDLGGFLNMEFDGTWALVYGENKYFLPYDKPLITSVPGKIEDLNHVKQHLINLGWDPIEWRERDLTRDTKKQKLSYEKQQQTALRYAKETVEKGLYKKERLEILGFSPRELYDALEFQLGSNKPVRVPTTPMVRVGVEKELCPNLVKLGDKVAFAKDFVNYLTYRHRLSSIAGGDIEDMDFDEETPNTGYLSVYRDEDGRVPTPAIEIGASSNRYRHVKIANVARVTSLYGQELRSLFGCGKDYFQLGFDFASLELRVQAGYIAGYPGGLDLGVSLTAEKPNDIHSVNSRKMGIPRGDAKSVGYALLYGAGPPKIAKMLGLHLEEGKTVTESYWNAMLPLKMYKQDLELEWEKNGKEFIIGIDGRKIRTRSQHSLLNAAFQSAGVICAKYTAVFLMQELENLNLCVDPFVARPDVCSMIEYHDEEQLMVDPSLIKFKMFETKEEAEAFVASWEGTQLSAISHGKKYFVALPNVVSDSVLKATKRVEDLLGLSFELGVEWIVGRNWAECH